MTVTKLERERESIIKMPKHFKLLKQETNTDESHAGKDPFLFTIQEKKIDPLKGENISTSQSIKLSRIRSHRRRKQKQYRIGLPELNNYPEF